MLEAWLGSLAESCVDHVLPQESPRSKAVLPSHRDRGWQCGGSASHVSRDEVGDSSLRLTGSPHGNSFLLSEVEYVVGFWAHHGNITEMKVTAPTSQVVMRTK